MAIRKTIDRTVLNEETTILAAVNKYPTKEQTDKMQKRQGSYVNNMKKKNDSAVKADF